MAATLQPPQFSCDLEQELSGPVIAPRGELDLASAETLQAVTDDLLRTRPRSLVVDLSGVTFIDSSGLRCLLALAATLRADGIELELVPAPDRAMRVFDLTATREVLPFRSAA